MDHKKSKLDRRGRRSDSANAPPTWYDHMQKHIKKKRLL